MDMTRRKRIRTTLYAAFIPGDGGTPVIGVWDWNKKRLDTLMSDRKANGEAFPGEFTVRIHVAMYNLILKKHGFPMVCQ